LTGHDLIAVAQTGMKLFLFQVQASY
jgi:hypothetical protein